MMDLFRNKNDRVMLGCLILILMLCTGSYAQDQKVPYPEYLSSLNWSPLLSGTFGEPTFQIQNQPYFKHPTNWGHIYYTSGYVSERDRVKEVISSVQSYYESIFGSSLNESPIDVYIIPQWWRDDVYGIAPDGDHVLLKPDGNSTFGFTVVHELCHLFQRRFFGNSTMDQAIDRKWFIEGLTDASAYKASQNKPTVSHEAQDVMDRRLENLYSNRYRGLYDLEYDTMPFWVYFMEKTSKNVRNIIAAAQNVLSGPDEEIAYALNLGREMVDYAKGLRNKTPYSPHSFLKESHEPKYIQGVVDKGLFKKIRIDLRPLCFRYYKISLVPSTGELVFFLRKIRELDDVDVYAVVRHSGGALDEDWSGKTLKILTRTGKKMGHNIPIVNFTDIELLLVNKSPVHKYMSTLLKQDSFEHETKWGVEKKEDDMILPIVGFTGGVRSTRTIVSEKKFAMHRGVLQLEFTKSVQTRNFSSLFWYLLGREIWENNGTDKELQAMLDVYAYFQGYVNFASLWEDAEFTYKIEEDEISDNLYKKTEHDALTPPQEGTLILKVPFIYLNDGAFMDKDKPNLYRIDLKTIVARMGMGGMPGAAAWIGVMTQLNAKPAEEGSLYDKINGLFRSTISLKMDPGKTRTVEFRIQHHKGRARWIVPLEKNVVVFFQPLYH